MYVLHLYVYICIYITSTVAAVWAVTFIPAHMPKTVCRANLHSKRVQLEVCRTFPGRGTGMSVTAHVAAAAVRQ